MELDRLNGADIIVAVECSQGDRVSPVENDSGVNREALRGKNLAIEINGAN